MRVQYEEYLRVDDDSISENTASVRRSTPEYLIAVG